MLKVNYGKRFLAILFLTVFSIHGNAQERISSACSVPPVDDKKIQSIAESYNKRFADVSNSAQNDTAAIKKAAPREGAVGWDMHIENRHGKFEFPVPNVTFRTEKVSMDLPETRMVTTTFSADMPAVITGTECRAGIDETVRECKTCRSDLGNFDYQCCDIRTRRGKDICLPTVKTEMRRESIKLDIPQVKMVRQDFSLDLPDIRFENKEMSFDYPVIIVDSVYSKEQDVNRKSYALKTNLEARTADLTKSMQGEVRGVTFGPIEASYNCASENLEVELRNTSRKLDDIIASFEAGYVRAVEIKSPEAIKSFEKTLAELRSAREKTYKEFEKQRAALNDEKRKALDKL